MRGAPCQSSLPAVVGRPYAIFDDEGCAGNKIDTALQESCISFEVQGTQISHEGGEPCSAQEWLHFFFFGMGPGYVMLDAIFVEVPWFQAVQPEGLRLASHMGLAGAGALGVSIPLYLACQRYISNRCIIPVLTSTSFVLTWTLASTWAVTVRDVSVAILLVVFMASTVGNLQTVVVFPWMTSSVKPRLLSAVTSGNNAGSLLGAALSLIQGPGKRQLFSPSHFFMFMSFPLMLPILAYLRIRSKSIGMLSTDESQLRNPHSPAHPHEPSKPAEAPSSSVRPAQQCSSHLVPIKFVLPTFWRRACGLCAVNACLQVFCWSVLRAVMPFAAANVVKRDRGVLCDEETGGSCFSPHGMGGEILQFCIELSYLGVTAGSLASTACTFNSASDLYPYVALFSFVAFAICSAALDVAVWHHDAAGALLVILVVTVRFIDGLLSPLLYRIVAVQFPCESEHVSKWIAVIEKICTVISTLIVYSAVEIFA